MHTCDKNVYVLIEGTFFGVCSKFLIIIDSLILLEINNLITIIFGSNKLINTNGILTFIDQQSKIKRELFKVELRSDLQPMLTAEIRDNKNQLLGKAYRSTSFVYTHPDYKKRARP